MEKELEKLGLTENEAKVYLALLALGESDASGIARQAQVKRPTTYLALEHLIKEGLVAEVANQKEKMFKAEAPEKLQKLTKKMRRKVIEAEIQLETVLPGLKAIQKKLIEAPQISFYQGKEGFKTVMEDITSSRQSWYYFGSVSEIIKSLGQEFINEMVAETDKFRREAGRPKAYMIVDEGIRLLSHFQKPAPERREIKILPSPVKNKSGFAVYGDKIGIFSIADYPFGAIIESVETSELVRMMFMMIWQSLPESKPETNRVLR